MALNPGMVFYVEGRRSDDGEWVPAIGGKYRLSTFRGENAAQLAVVDLEAAEKRFVEFRISVVPDYDPGPLDGDEPVKKGSETLRSIANEPPTGAGKPVSAARNRRHSNEP